MTFKQAFTSSLGQKLVMGLTGLFLISFLIVHAGLNACIWADDQGKMFNVAAHFMGSTIVVRIMEIGLFVFFFIHIIQGYVLSASNMAKRKQGYAVTYGNRGSKWFSRSMGLLGTLLLLFLIMHIYHFWTPSRLGGVADIQELAPVVYEGDSHVYHDLYREMLLVFRDNALVVVLYVIGCASLAFHVAHGFHAAFRTLGVHNRTYAKGLRNFGWGFAIVISVAFAMMPVSIYMRWIN